ncbi:MAG: hypothetical protein AAGH92_02780 [Planctomycetota bacterium]
MIWGAGVPRRVVLSSVAQSDIDEIAFATVKRYGWGQFELYEAKMRRTLDEIVRAPHGVPARVEPELTRLIGHASAVWSRHLGRRARHRWYYRVVDDAGAEVVQVARLLHDAMEPTRHVGEGFDDLSA